MRCLFPATRCRQLHRRTQSVRLVCCVDGTVRVDRLLRQTQRVQEAPHSFLPFARLRRRCTPETAKGGGKREEGARQRATLCLCSSADKDSRKIRIQLVAVAQRSLHPTPQAAAPFGANRSPPLSLSPGQWHSCMVGELRCCTLLRLACGARGGKQLATLHLINHARNPQRSHQADGCAATPVARSMKQPFARLSFV